MANNKSYSYLHRCLSYWDLDLLMSKLRNDIDINEIDESGNTPLHVAAGQNYQEVLEMLLERGADVNRRNTSGNTPLHEGIENYKVVKTLLDNGASLDLKNCNWETPLHIAVQENNLPVVNLLLSLGVQINEQNKFGLSPLHEAVLNRSHEMIKILIDKGANVNGESKQVFISVQINDFSITEVIHQVDTPLHLAAENEFYSVVNILLNEGANPNVNGTGGEKPLHISARLGDFKSIKLLLEKGADVNVRRVNEGNSPLHLAAQTNELLAIDLMIRAGAIVNLTNDEGGTALHEATRYIALESAERLLEAGADVNLKNIHGNTPLHIAAVKQDFSFRNLELTQKLLDWGASVHHINVISDIACGEQLTLLKKHLVKLESVNMYQSVITDFKDYKSFRLSCLEELEAIKRRMCGKYILSDIFFMYYNPLFVNDILVEKELSRLNEEFPIYSSLLKLTFKKAKIRYSLMCKLLRYFNLNNFPAEIKWKILTYFSDEDLEYILKVL